MRDGEEEEEGGENGEEEEKGGEDDDSRTPIPILAASENSYQPGRGGQSGFGNRNLSISTSNVGEN